MAVRIEVRWGQDDGHDVVDEQSAVIYRPDLEQALTAARETAGAKMTGTAPSAAPVHERETVAPSFRPGKPAAF